MKTITINEMARFTSNQESTPALGSHVHCTPMPNRLSHAKPSQVKLRTLEPVSHCPTDAESMLRRPYTASASLNAPMHIYLVQPKSAHDEEELNAHRTERQDASQSDRERWVGVPHLFRHVPVSSRTKAERGIVGQR